MAAAIAVVLLLGICCALLALVARDCWRVHCELEDIRRDRIKLEQLLFEMQQDTSFYQELLNNDAQADH